MTDISVLATVPNKILHVGGDQHSGWLPAQAAQPVPTPLREVVFNFEIQFDGSGYLLCYSSVDGSLFGDTWHPTQSETEQVALDDFGIHSHEWHRV